jgi:diguanylate cyclase (GGDEF)-like protein/PAS domain S-box-containing protein
VVIANSVIISERSFDTTQRRIGKDNFEEESLWRGVEGGSLNARLRSEERQSTSLEWPERNCLGILDDSCKSKVSGEPTGMKPTEPDPTNPVDIVYPRAQGLARVRGMSRGERWFRSLLQNSSDVVMILEADGTMRYVSSAVERVLGYRPEDFVGTLAFDYVHPEDIEYVSKSFAETLEKPGVQPPIEYRVRTADGTWRHLEVIRSNRLDDPHMAGVVTNVRDVTERKEAEEALRGSEASLAESQRIAHLGAWEWDVVTGEVWWSEETYRIYGFDPGEGINVRQKLEEALFPEDLPRYRRTIDEALSGEAEGYDHEHRIRRPDGEVSWVHGQAEVVRGEDGGPLRMIGTVHDVTERKALEDRLRHQAFHDPLTDLPNRELFLDRLGHALARTERRPGKRVAVLFMDLDDFKVVNDSLGHEAGDLLLVAVAERLMGCMRPEDTLARFGGDEFTVLLEDLDDPEEAVRVAERIIDEVRDPFVLEGREFYVRASIGITLGEDRTKDLDDLLREADIAMYWAKDQGSGYSMFNPAMFEKALGRLEAANYLRRAIEREDFVVHYQPIFGFATGEVWGVEALVRWDHPERGLLDPSEFVAVAEESGLVVPMGEGVLREACLRAKEWQETHPRNPPLVMAVNLSARQLSRPDLAETVERVLRETGLEGNRLTLDITETVYVKTLAGNTAALDRLRSLGVKISIDDFGMGYSWLSYLKRLPANSIKIDRSFVRGLGEDDEDTAIVGMIIELAHTLGIEVVAEGVESEEQARVLTEMSCDFAQGFYFSKPVPPEAAAEFLAN